jgi:hypothetical protein
MADVFLSYSRANRAQAARVSEALEAGGRSLWWDRELASGEDYAQVIEREIEAARCVVVAWSATARDSLWVRAEANEALDQEKLVQINFDGAKPPLPFTMLHWLDFSGWTGERSQMPWPHLDARVDSHLGQGRETGDGRRPDPGGVPVVAGAEPALQGFNKAAALGWAALATTILLALSVLMVARDLISASAFGAISVAALAVSAVLLAACSFLVLRVEKASRR